MRIRLSRPDLETERLVLRHPNIGDIADIVNVVGAWDVASRLARVPHPYGEADAQFFLDQVVPFEWTWAITLKGDDRLIGTIGLTPADGEEAAELGYWLSPDHWQQGIATEASRAVISFGFDTLQLPYLTSGFFEHNPASGRVLEKLGFVEVARVMRSCVALSREAPSVQMRLERPMPC